MVGLITFYLVESCHPTAIPIRFISREEGPLRFITYNAQSLRCHSDGDFQVGLELVFEALFDLRPSARTLIIGVQET